MESYRDLIVWQKSMDLAVEIYRLIKLLPREEMYGLSDQMRRSATSIPANISEGYGRNATGDYIRFLNISRGSRHELETQLLICVRVGYLTENQTALALKYCDEVGRMLNSLISKLSSNP
ncbi:MAG: four helix bundle protein [Thermoguttaceae bacterium]|nr:four helix bundle protein [Thermoguttaceae bacterium]MBR5709552.1 four helix bundle protein [Thermoguttaceae bacterium]MBR6436310.1 four helix bundle protein [Thermoguttaceae bacterium]